MTNEEAMNLLDNLKGMIDDSQGNDYDSAFKSAIKALEKQIPKEIEQFIVDGKMSRRCPNGCDITGATMWATLNYCPYCGKAIKWE